MLRRSVILACSAVSSAAIIIGLISLFGDDNGIDSVEEDMDSPAPTAQLSGDFDEELADLGITYTVMTDSSVDVSNGVAGMAHESVLSEFGGVLDERADYVVEHVEFTDENYGPVDNPDSPDPTVKPYFVDREALMIVLIDQAIPVSGPPNVDKPSEVDSTFVGFVDMESNDVLTAVSFAT